MADIAEFDTYRKSIKACKLCGADIAFKSGQRAVPPYLNPEVCTALVVGFAPEEQDFSRKQPAPFTGECGKALSAALQASGLRGNPRMGYTTVVKCRLKSGTVKPRCSKNCMRQNLWREIETINPNVIVVLGEDAARFIAPDVLKAQKNKRWEGTYRALSGNDFYLFDRHLFFTYDLNDILTKNKFDSSETKGEFLELVSHLQKVREYL